MISLKEEECLFLPIEAPTQSDSETDPSIPLLVPKHISEIDKKWVAKHCKSILRMLPGGVRISGLFATASNQDVLTHELHIIQILSAMSSADKTIFKGLIPNQSSEKIILYSDPESKQLFCKAIDVDDCKDQLCNVEIRIKPILCNFTAVKTCVSLCFSALIPTDRKKEKILKKLEEASEPFLLNLVNRTDLLICGNRHEDGELLFESLVQEPSLEQKINTKKNVIRLKKALIDTSDSSTSDYWSNLVFVFYGPDYHFPTRAHSTSSSESGASSDTGFTGSSSSLHFGQRDGDRERSYRARAYSGQRSASGISPVKETLLRSGFRSADEETTSDFYSNDQPISIQGVIPGIAFLPTKTSTVADVKKAFREDLVRSTLSRLELLSDQLHISSGELESESSIYSCQF
ncbi:hypothetical protein Ciccas_007349 [Cichlidogyrus casuarinus]|uniref:Uncharacterized protein n=1 Tax=Cichlidogyrus casuarinus TaxID=1844966 RepID=A0ABD2Q746_9PLAT